MAPVPLFRNFPDSTPEDTYELYLERTLTHVFASPEQPCLNCTNVDHVYVLDPCGHLVCTSAGTRRTTARARSAIGGSPWTARSGSPRPLASRSGTRARSRSWTSAATSTPPLPRLHGPAGPHDAAPAPGSRGPRGPRPPLRRRAGARAHPRARDDGADLRHLAGVRPRPAAPEDGDRRAAGAVRRAWRRGRPGQAAEAAPEHPATDPAVRPAVARRPSTDQLAEDVRRRGAALEANRREAPPVRVPGPLPEHGAGVRRDPPYPRG